MEERRDGGRTKGVGEKELATLPELPPTFPLQLALGGRRDHRAGSAL